MLFLILVAASAARPSALSFIDGETRICSEIIHVEKNWPQGTHATVGVRRNLEYTFTKAPHGQWKVQMKVVAKEVKVNGTGFTGEKAPIDMEDRKREVLQDAETYLMRLSDDGLVRPNGQRQYGLGAEAKDGTFLGFLLPGKLSETKWSAFVVPPGIGLTSPITFNYRFERDTITGHKPIDMYEFEGKVAAPGAQGITHTVYDFSVRGSCWQDPESHRLLQSHVRLSWAPFGGDPFRSVPGVGIYASVSRSLTFDTQWIELPQSTPKGRKPPNSGVKHN